MELHELLDEYDKLNEEREKEVRQRVNSFWNEVLHDLKVKSGDITNIVSGLKAGVHIYTILFIIVLIALAINLCFLFYTVNSISKPVEPAKLYEPAKPAKLYEPAKPAKLYELAKPVESKLAIPSNFEEFVKQAKLDYFQFDTLLSEQGDVQIGLTTNTTNNVQSLYVLIDNKYLVVDSVYDLAGNNISLANVEKAKAYTSVTEIAKTQDKTTNKANERLNQAYNNIKTGNGYYQFDFNSDKTIYAYYDLDCGYCQKTKMLFEDHKDLFTEHKLNVYWLPVAILSNDLEKVSDRLANAITPEQIAENTNDFNNLGVQGVPVFMWKEQDTVMGYVGAMQKKDLLDIFDSI